MAKNLSEQPSIDPSAKLRDCTLGRYTEVGARTIMQETTFDDYSYIVQDGEVAYTQVGKFCSIASHVRINPGNHPMQRASQAHFSYRASAYWPEEDDEAEFFAWRRSTPVVIGHGVIILPGRRIGTGAVLGGGAIVTRDVPPYAIVVGNPARVVRMRFAAPIAERLQALAWWDWSHAALRQALPDFRKLPIVEFLEKYEAR